MFFFFFFWGGGLGVWVLCSGLRVSKVVDSAVGYLTEEQTLHTRCTAEKS